MNLFSKTPFLIGEISFNYYDFVNDDFSYFDIVKLMIGKAKESGVNAINFHVGNCEICDFKEISQTDNLTFDEYKQLFEVCHENGLQVIVTSSDFDAIDDLDEFADAYKISSSDLSNIPLIEHVARRKKPILLSTAAATLNDINRAVDSIENQSNFKIAIMHSVFSYPTELEDANLLMIKDLAVNFPDYNIGYSDYTKSDNNMFVLTTAYNYGAIILEKLFTLDKSLEGHEYSMDCDDVRVFRLNAEVISRINGYKNKQPLICESSARKNLRKSIFAKKDIKSGDVIEKSDIEFKMPGNGISPSQINDVVGKTAKVDIKINSLIDFEMLK